MRVRYRLDVAMLLALFACGGTESTAPPDVASVEVTCAAGDVVGTMQCTATALAASGQPIAGKEFTWSSSDPSVATIDSSTGFVTVVGAGETMISAATDGMTGSTTLTGVSAPRISVAPDSVAFLGDVGAPIPSQDVSITNAGGVRLRGLDFEVRYAQGQPVDWLDVSLAGQVAPTTLTVTPVPDGLQAGQYSADILVTSTSPDVANSPVTIPVTLSLN